tara:strand:+ start:216 stop:1118 length:903 start_codon:yes stop_codon:yes gene_type:complete
MGLGPQVIALYVQLKRNGTFDNITKVMEFGSQDLVFPGEKYNSLLVDLFETFDCDVPFEEELKQMVKGPAKDVYEHLGLKYSCLDTDGKYNALVLDINIDDVPSEHLNRYDLVTNHGTTEHLINQLNGFKMVHDFTQSGGLMLHVLPFIGYLDHGYFNYQPNLFKNLASYNSYETLGMWINIDTHLSSMIPWQDNLLNYIKLSPSCDSCLAVLMRKKNDSEFSIPFQGHYENTRVDQVRSYYLGTTDGEFQNDPSNTWKLVDINRMQEVLKLTSGKLLLKELINRFKLRIKRLITKTIDT